MNLEDIKPGMHLVYIGINEPFTLAVLNVEPDEDGMIRVQRLRDGGITWVRTDSLRPMTVEEARKAADGKDIVMRSCWQCNAAHGHLKLAPYVVYCLFGCGRAYWKGVCIYEPDGEEDSLDPRRNLDQLVNITGAKGRTPEH